LQVWEHRLSARQNVNARKAIVSLLIPDACPVHAFGQVLAAIDADLHGPLKPGLQAHVHQAKLAIGKVKVDEQALASCQTEFQVPSFWIATHFEGPTKLHAGDHADQTSLNAVPLHDAAR